MTRGLYHGAIRGTALAACLLASAATAAEWRITAINGAATQGAAGLRLTEDGGIAGSTGCNRFTGTAGVSAGEIEIGQPLATTRMACPDPDLAAQEDSVLRLLTGTIAIRFDPVSGSMILTRGEDSMTLVPGPFAADAGTDTDPAQFGARYLNVFGLSGPLNIRSEPSTDSHVVTRVLSGTLLRNEGCVHQPDRDWCQIAFLDPSGRTGWAAAEYLQPAPALIRAKDSVFDRIGTLSCAVPAGDPVQDCDYGLARDGGHSAALVIYRPDGGEVLLGFVDGILAVASEGQETLADVSGTEEDGVLRLSVSGARYDVSRALLTEAGE